MTFRKDNRLAELGAVVDDTADGIHQFFPSAVGRLVNRQLELIHQSDDAVCVRHFRNLSQIVVALVVVEGVHRAGWMVLGGNDA